MITVLSKVIAVTSPLFRIETVMLTQNPSITTQELWGEASQVRESRELKTADITFNDVSLTEPSLYTELSKKFDSPNKQDRIIAAAQLRCKDDVYLARQGIIPIAFIQEEQRAIDHLVITSLHCDTLFAMERGGGMAMDLIEKRREVLGHSPIPTERSPKQCVRNDHVKDLLKRISTYLEKNPNATIGICETAISGSSVNSILKILLKEELLKRFPNAKIIILALKQTLQEDNPDDVSSIQINNSIAKETPNTAQKKHSGIDCPKQLSEQVTVIIAKTRYLLGEDIDFQLKLNPTPEESKRPIIVFDDTDEINVQKITHSLGARQALVELIAGTIIPIPKNNISDNPSLHPKFGTSPKTPSPQPLYRQTSTGSNTSESVGSPTRFSPEGNNDDREIENFGSLFD